MRLLASDPKAIVSHLNYRITIKIGLHFEIRAVVPHVRPVYTRLRLPAAFGVFESFDLGANRQINGSQRFPEQGTLT